VTHSRRSQRTIAAWLATTVVLGLVATGCGGSSAPSGGAPHDTTVNLAMKDNFFDPKEITVPAGAKVTFSMKNEGVALHNIHIFSDDATPKNPITQPIGGGATSQLVVTFPKKGTVKFQCDLHTPDMAGTITVK